MNGLVDFNNHAGACAEVILEIQQVCAALKMRLARQCQCQLMPVFLCPQQLQVGHDCPCHAATNRGAERLFGGDDADQHGGRADDRGLRRPALL